MLTVEFSSASATPATWVVPAGASYLSLEVYGSAGALAGSSSYRAGWGAGVSCVFPATPGDVLAILVGGQGSTYGGGNGYEGDADGGGLTAVANQTTGTLLVVAGGGGGSDGTGNGGDGGEVGTSATAGTAPGGGATQSAAGTASTGYNGTGPTSYASGAFSLGLGGSGSGVSGGGAGYYGGAAGGQVTLEQGETADGYSSTTTVYSSGTTTDPPPSGSQPSDAPPSSWQYSTSSPSSYVYSVTQSASGWPDYTWNVYNTTTATYSSNQGGSFTESSSTVNSEGHVTYYQSVFNLQTVYYSYTTYEVSYTQNYSSYSYYSVTSTGPGGGGSSWAAPSALDVSFQTGAQEGEGLVIVTVEGPQIVTVI